MKVVGFIFRVALWVTVPFCLAWVLGGLLATFLHGLFTVMKALP